MSVSFEYAASVSQWIPAGALTPRQHLERFVRDHSGLTPHYNYSFRQHMDAYYASVSGLPGGTTDEHIEAYFASQTALDDEWVAEVSSFVTTVYDSLEYSPPPVTVDIFTANFEEDF